MVVTMVIIQCLRDLLHLAVLPTVTGNGNLYYKEAMLIFAGILVVLKTAFRFKAL
ncbi:unnamed protein product [Brugia timori]|uniref:Branched-chain amino acid ABC transporter permease n=1 Tax=Brugia timori TaxID=42155 RepID=A0A0R3R294_9BILA|nr:unnamed protein product [Brugia timori]